MRGEVVNGRQSIGMVCAQAATLQIKQLAILRLGFRKAVLACQCSGQPIHESQRLWILRALAGGC